MRYVLTVYDFPTPMGRKRAAMTEKGKTFYPEAKDVKASFRIRDTWLKSYGDLRSDGLPREPMLMGPVALTIFFYKKAPSNLPSFKRKAYWRKPLGIRKPDFDNMEKQVCDALTGYAWHDDGQITWSVTGKFYALYPDGSDESPHFDIYFEPIDDSVEKPHGNKKR